MKKKLLTSVLLPLGSFIYGTIDFIKDNNMKAFFLEHTGAIFIVLGVIGMVTILVVDFVQRFNSAKNEISLLNKLISNQNSIILRKIDDLASLTDKRLSNLENK